MTEPSTSENIDVDNLESDFLSLKIGESIPRLEISTIRKLTSPGKEDNLKGVDYKFLIETTDRKLLKVNSWTLWRRISDCLKKAGKVQVTLSLAHLGINDYKVELAK